MRKRVLLINIALILLIILSTGVLSQTTFVGTGTYGASSGSGLFSGSGAISSSGAYSDRGFGGGVRGTASYVNYGTPFTNYYAGEGRLSTYWPILSNKDTCEARQDILIQVSPAGCQPAVVRSDLLAEQNVPIFCQLDALMVNPAIDVKQIRNMRFNGKYPPEVAGVGYHPARAALRTRDRLLGSPLEDNIGYIVIVLKRQPNEKEMPDFLNFVLSASIDYYSGNAIGVGKTELLLNEVSDAEWENERIRQSFLKGRYSVRMVESDPQFIDLKIYDGDVQVSSLKVERRKTSQQVYLPGSYCQTALQFSFDDYVSPDKIAKIQVGDDTVDVYTGSRFLDGKCVVRKINGDQLDGSVELGCGSQRFLLKTKYRVYDEGTKVLLTEQDGKNIAGKWRITKVNENKGERTYDLVNDENKQTKKGVSLALIRPENGQIILDKSYGDGNIYFDNAVSNYNYVTSNYGDEKRTTDAGENYGETAMQEAIELALEAKKDITAARLIEEYLERYPGGNSTQRYALKLNSLYSVDSSESSVVADTESGPQTIFLREVISPKKKSSAQIVWGTQTADKIELGSSANFAGGTVSLANIIDANTVQVNVACKGSQRSGGLITLRLSDTNNRAPCVGNADVIKVNSIDVELYAKVRINPVTRTGTTTNFSVGVGIEKRALELTPSKARKRIENLDNTIKKWESISNNLGNVVRGLKAACFATAGVLTVKNFFAGLSGEALARQQVMRGEGGWSRFCEAELSAKRVDSMTQCYNKYSSEISTDIDARTNAIKKVNDVTSEIEKRNKYPDSGGAFGGGSFKDEEAKKELIDKINRECSDVPITSKSGGINGKTKIGQLLEGTDAYKSVSYEQLRDLYFNCLVTQSGESSTQGATKSQADLETLGIAIDERMTYEKNLGAAKSFIGNTGLADGQVDAYGDRNSLTGKYYGKTLNEGDFGLTNDYKGKKAQMVTYKGETYLVVLEDIEGGNYKVNEAFSVDSSGRVINTAEDRALATELIKDKFSQFEKRDVKSYYNQYAKGEYEARFFETEPYKGMPAIVPFETRGFSGFYAATQQSLPLLGGTKSFESNGRPSSFWVCNIMDDGRIDFYSSGFGKDECVQFNFYTGQSFSNFPGLTEQQTKVLVQDASKALEDAARGYGQKNVKISTSAGTKTLSVGKAAAVIPGTQCQDYMSPGDCKLLFNVCDPVICPASRCNFGGAYQVADVIQTGIVGSALLCLPNYKEGIIAPVCLTGIKAGIDGYLSILKSHQACLQENLESGKYVGICDQITSVYMCEFFWRQAAPIANALLPKVVETLYSGGQGGLHGGGEYLTVQSSWQNAQDSVNYFTQSYAVNSIEAFQIRSIEEAGTPFCRAFISAKGPKTFESLIEPDSPPQFHAWYSEIPFSDATVPATSQYKVFYHIYSGKDRGTAFSVYLKDPPSNTQYRATPYITIATGFAPKGGFATETRDFTAPKGYKQLCVRINDREECGFKQVSSSFAVNYVRDELVQDELTKADITGQKECIAGTVNPLAILNPGIQESASEAVDPAVYNRGVVRICATSNPGIGTDPSRFVNVGYCDNPRVGCWLDKKSVDNALTDYNKGAKEETLSELNTQQRNNYLQEGSGFKSEENVGIETRALTEEVARATKDDEKKIAAKIDDLIIKTLFNNQKAELFLLKAQLYRNIFRQVLGSGAEVKKTVGGSGASWADSAGGASTTAIISFEGGQYIEANRNYILLNGKNTDVYIQNSEVFYGGVKVGYIDESGNMRLQGTEEDYRNIESIFGFGSSERLEGVSVRSLEYDGFDLNGAGSSVGTGGENRILSLESSYDPANKTYWMLDGRRTDIYFIGNKIYLRDNTKQIGSVNGGKILLLTGSKSDIMAMVAFGDGAFEIINGRQITDEIDLDVSSGRAVGGTSVPTDTKSFAILKLQKGYRAGEKIFLLMNGKETKLYLKDGIFKKSQWWAILGDAELGYLDSNLVKIYVNVRNGDREFSDLVEPIIDGLLFSGAYDIIRDSTISLKQLESGIDLLNLPTAECIEARDCELKYGPTEGGYTCESGFCYSYEPEKSLQERFAQSKFYNLKDAPDELKRVYCGDETTLLYSSYFSGLLTGPDSIWYDLNENNKVFSEMVGEQYATFYKSENSLEILNKMTVVDNNALNDIPVLKSLKNDLDEVYYEDFLYQNLVCNNPDGKISRESYLTTLLAENGKDIYLNGKKTDFLESEGIVFLGEEEVGRVEANRVVLTLPIESVTGDKAVYKYFRDYVFVNGRFI